MKQYFLNFDMIFANDNFSLMIINDIVLTFAPSKDCDIR